MKTFRAIRPLTLRPHCCQVLSHKSSPRSETFGLELKKPVQLEYMANVQSEAALAECHWSVISIFVTATAKATANSHKLEMANVRNNMQAELFHCYSPVRLLC
jgi:hypothetical protein